MGGETYMVQRLEIEETEIPRRNYEKEEETGPSWLPLLIIPLMLGGLLWGLQSYSRNAGDRQNTGEQQFGVGGAPMVTKSASPTLTPTATPTTTPTPTPSLSPIVDQEDSTSPKSGVSPTDILDDVL